MKEYSQILDYLYGLEKFGMVFGLENITWLLGLIGNPQDSLKTVHIAGTNGKGSVASMLSEILKTAGYATGMYTSPHLISFTERITVNGDYIPEAEVAELTEYIKERIDQEESPRPLTFFDFTTALAFEYFKRKGVAIAVVEAGLGGRLDSTNVLRPLVTVITNVALDHQEYLGNTIKEIAREKAGVVKEHVPVVTGAKGESLEIIKAAAVKTALYALDENFTYKKKGEQLMWYRGIRMTYDDLSVALGGTTSFSTRPSPSARWSSSARPVSPSKSMRSGRGLRRCSGRRGSSWSASPENPSSSSTAPTTPTGWAHSSRT